MNIFVSDPDPRISAQNLDDKRVVKMILESAQILSTAMNELGLKGPYKSTHVNHPCSVWARSSRANYFWLLEHMQFLCMEYTFRYGKTHKCAAHLHTFFMARNNIQAIDSTPFQNCTPYKDIDDVHEAYKMTLREKWLNDKRKPKWTNRQKPF